MTHEHCCDRCGDWYRCDGRRFDDDEPCAGNTEKLCGHCETREPIDEADRPENPQDY